MSTLHDAQIEAVGLDPALCSSQCALGVGGQVSVGPMTHLGVTIGRADELVLVQVLTDFPHDGGRDAAPGLGWHVDQTEVQAEADLDLVALQRKLRLAWRFFAVQFEDVHCYLGDQRCEY